jgi:hypothetical protein
MLVACRLAGLSALEAHYAKLNSVKQCPGWRVGHDKQGRAWITWNHNTRSTTWLTR